MMTGTYKSIQFLKLLILLSILIGTGSSQLPPPDRAMIPGDAPGPASAEFLEMPRCPVAPMGVPVELILGGRGFALRDNETHLFRLNVERFMPIEPGKIRDLLASNKSVEEIRETIKAWDGAAQYRGIMWLDRVPYYLTNISVSPSGDNATITEANLVIPDYGAENQSSIASSIAGHLAITVYPSVEGGIGEGKLIMNSPEHSGSYRVLLDMAVRAMPFQANREHIYIHESFSQSLVSHLMGFIHRLFGIF